jgi:hypothetical protein
MGDTGFAGIGAERDADAARGSVEQLGAAFLGFPASCPARGSVASVRLPVRAE